MIRSEAKWLGQALDDIADEDLFPLLNVGSQDALFRTVRQPWMERYLFAPLARRGGQVIHLDLQEGAGIDVSGDLLDPRTRELLASRRVRSVLCANVLEHVADREAFASVLESLVPRGGYLIVTVPKAFPHHPDPIDTMFRPDGAQLVKLFPRLVPTCVHVASGTLLGYVFDRLREAPTDFLASASATGGGGPSRSDFLAWLFRRIETTCVILRRE